jgi:hypothetical protein
VAVVIFLVDGRFGIGSDQDQQESESVMAILWGTLPPGHTLVVAQQLDLTRSTGPSVGPSLQCAPPGCTGSGANTDCERKHLGRLLVERAAM